MLCRKDNTSRAEKCFHHNIKQKTGDVMMCIIHEFVKTDKCGVERSLEIHAQMVSYLGLFLDFPEGPVTAFQWEHLFSSIKIIPRFFCLKGRNLLFKVIDTKFLALPQWSSRCPARRCPGSRPERRAGRPARLLPHTGPTRLSRSPAPCRRAKRLKIPRAGVRGESLSCVGRRPSRPLRLSAPF